MIDRRTFLGQGLALVASGAAGAELSYDVVVYGGTAAGVTAATEAARIGRSVLLVEPGRHIGGMTSGGLGATDYGRKPAVGGLAREFYGRVKRYYASDAVWKYERREDYRNHGHDPSEDVMWFFEPHVAESLLQQMLAEAGVSTVLGERLDLRNGIRKTGPRIASIRMESGRSFAAKVFIDATYEGDLMARAGVRYCVGREPDSQYGESTNGVRPRIMTKEGHGNSLGHFLRAVDPYIRPGDPSSGLLPGVKTKHLPPLGSGDAGVQAYNYRLCLTDVPGNRVAIEKPKTYDPMQYELMLRLITSEVRFPEFPDLPKPEHPVLGWNPFMVIMPNRKTDTNTKGAVSSDFVGENWKYPDGDYAIREAIVTAHREYQQGMIWFLANDPRVPDRYRLPIQKWGLAKDEFPDTNHWPHQLYVREARRMIGEYVMTEHNCTGREVAGDSVGLGSYGLDSHHVQRYVDDRGYAQCDGQMVGNMRQPYPISYRSMTPRPNEADNLLVPVCLSATHPIYGSIRMEPTYMVLGQSAGAAAALAIEYNLPIQRVPYPRLRAVLLKGNQKLSWPVA